MCLDRGHSGITLGIDIQTKHNIEKRIKNYKQYLNIKYLSITNGIC